MKKIISSLVISGLCASGACFGMNEDLAKNEVEAITEKAGKNLMVKKIKRAEKNNRKVRTVLGLSIAAAGSAFAYHYLRATKNPTVNVSVSKISGNGIVSPELPSFDTVRSLTKVLNFAKSYPTATSLPTIGGLASIAVATAYFIKKKSADSGKVEDRACISRYISDMTKRMYLKIQELRESVFEYFESEIFSDISSDKVEDRACISRYISSDMTKRMYLKIQELRESVFEYFESETFSEISSDKSDEEDFESETSSEASSDKEDEGTSFGGDPALTINEKLITVIKSATPMRNEQEIYQKLTKLNMELNKDWASLSGSEMDLAKFQELDSELDSILDKLEGRDYISKCVYDRLHQVKKKRMNFLIKTLLKI